MIRFALVLSLTVHGLAHVSGFLASWTKATVDYFAKPRVLPGSGEM